MTDVIFSHRLIGFKLLQSAELADLSLGFNIALDEDINLLDVSVNPILVKVGDLLIMNLR